MKLSIFPITCLAASLAVAGPIPAQDAAIDLQPGKKYVKSPASQGFFLRRDQEAAAVPKEDGVAPDDTGGALFSFSRNYETGIDQTVARGVIGYSESFTWNQFYENYNPENPASLIDFGYTASALFDKVNIGGGEEGETDILQFNLSTSFHYDLPGTGGNRLLDSLVVTAAASDATDFDFDRHVVGGQLDIAPVNGLLSGQMLRQINLGPDAAFRLYPNWQLHLEGGTVSGGDGPAAARDDFVRAGARGSVIFQFGPWRTPNPAAPTSFNDRFRLSASYLHYEGITSGTESTSLFSAGAEYRWPDQRDDAGNYRPAPLSLKIEYRNGEIPFAQVRDESITIGFGVRF